MGRKRTRAWKQICFCITSLIFLSLLSCAAVDEIRRYREAREYLLQGQKILAQGDYEGALSEFQKVLSMSISQTQKAEALFNIGLLYAHFGYPKKNYEKSLIFFINILNDCQESPLVEQAKIWVGILEENEKLNQVIRRLKQVDIEIEELRKKKAQ